MAGNDSYEGYEGQAEHVTTAVGHIDLTDDDGPDLKVDALQNDQHLAFEALEEGDESPQYASAGGSMRCRRPYRCGGRRDQNRKSLFNLDSTLLLIRLYQKYRGTRYGHDMWPQVARGMRAAGYPFDGLQCGSRFRQLKSRYYRIRQRLLNGDQRIPKFHFYDILDSIFRDVPKGEFLPPGSSRLAAPESFSVHRQRELATHSASEAFAGPTNVDSESQGEVKAPNSTRSVQHPLTSMMEASNDFEANSGLSRAPSDSKAGSKLTEDRSGDEWLRRGVRALERLTGAVTPLTNRIVAHLEQQQQQQERQLQLLHRTTVALESLANSLPPAAR